jgi:hypothetical protein
MIWAVGPINPDGSPVEVERHRSACYIICCESTEIIAVEGMGNHVQRDVYRTYSVANWSSQAVPGSQVVSYEIRGDLSSITLVIKGILVATTGR